ncbi:DUF1294 domain-containing protein [Pseudomonas sp. LJDD11]|uniref:DUF1294 domain-containing protein n=1 Tax=Pseudomonas sp. LJDD11 TaxID=2931984 RepID=UPI00211CCB3A|nr:DUF1294 domain-containing protein [Pseudomonas sp. LJDD11]MCQ9423101.1 DUF1294 domain-containing protein [Pseudomonas sp. LJDD11]
MSRTRSPAPARQQPRQQPHQPVRALRIKLLVGLGLCALPVVGIAGRWPQSAMLVCAALYLLMSLLALLLYRHDKRQAGQGGQRVAENTLHLIELLGGWPGALLAQQLYRHKTRKLSFQIVFWLIVIAHQIFWVDWVLLERQLSAFLLV